MSRPVVLDFPYCEHSAQLFGVLAHQPWAAFLDSCYPYHQTGRYDILCANPLCTLETHGTQTQIHRHGARHHSMADPLQLLQEALGPIAEEGIDGIPFCGGAVGYFGYDLGRRWTGMPPLSRSRESLPEMAIGIYDQALVVDHQEQRSWLVGRNLSRMEQLHQYLQRAWKPSDKTWPSTPYCILSKVCSNMTKAEYLEAIAQIKRYLLDGDCYQVNFAQRFSVPAEGDPWQAYQELRQRNPAPFAAYLKTPWCQVLSSSPERFLQLRNGWVETQPIKGTAPRGADPSEDRVLAQSLKNSSKDQAENLMIVDLLRNDLGKVCAIGSVTVPELFQLESYARVHHLVSKVAGRLDQGQDALSLLRACFPGGSITGAPKLRAMQVIEALEPHRRGIYCGAIGYIGFNGNMDSNIAIRTMVHSKGTARFWSGGGIVIDSDPEAEYQETYHKAAALLDLLHRIGSVSSQPCR
jgi:para-aminobenzoate synthetase component 1